MTSMISAAMNGKLNEQITSEFASSYTYLAMACSFDEQGYKVLAQRFFSQAEEERAHAMKFVKYVLDVGGQVKLGAVAKPGGDFSSPVALFKAALEAELKVTREVNGLVALAEEENDYTTRSFMQWFLDEQVEEVASMRDLLQLAERASDMFWVESYVRDNMKEAPRE